MNESTNHQQKVISYISGFVLSVILTVAAYFTITKGLVSGWGAIWILSGLAIAQLAVQLLFFLHLNRQKANRERLQLFNFAAIVVVIVVGGTLWIMNNLHYNMDTDKQDGLSTEQPTERDIEQDIVNDEGIDVLQTN